MKVQLKLILGTINLIESLGAQPQRVVHTISRLSARAGSSNIVCTAMTLPDRRWRSGSDTLLVVCIKYIAIHLVARGGWWALFI